MLLQLTFYFSICRTSRDPLPQRHVFCRKIYFVYFWNYLFSKKYMKICISYCWAEPEVICLKTLLLEFCKDEMNRALLTSSLKFLRTCFMIKLHWIFKLGRNIKFIQLVNVVLARPNTLLLTYLVLIVSRAHKAFTEDLNYCLFADICCTMLQGHPWSFIFSTDVRRVSLADLFFSRWSLS